MAPVNGSISGDKTTYPNLLKFECDEGFTLNGFDERHCQANGKWSGNATYCQGGTNFLKYEDKSFVTLLLFFFNAFNQPDNRLHNTDLLSSWNLANNCGPLQAPMNGTLSGNRTTYPNKINFKCDDGFILQGSTVRQCQPNKHWSGNDTFCEGTW